MLSVPLTGQFDRLIPSAVSMASEQEPTLPVGAQLSSALAYRPDPFSRPNPSEKEKNRGGQAEAGLYIVSNIL